MKQFHQRQIFVQPTNFTWRARIKAETRLFASKVSNLKIVLVNGERKLYKDNEKVSTLPLKEAMSPLAKPPWRLHIFSTRKYLSILFLWQYGKDWIISPRKIGNDQSKLLGQFAIFLPSQCWCARFGRAKWYNQHWEDQEMGTDVKKQRWVEVSQQFLSETVGILL